MDNPLIGLLILIAWCGIGGQVLLYLEPKFDQFMTWGIDRLVTWVESLA
jgi:hypothetical protein